MRFWKVEMSNGLCGCDEEFVTMTNDNEELLWEDVLEMYSYTEGYCGMDDEEDMEDYLEDIGCYSSYEEITEEEFNQLLKEEEYFLKNF